jgi:hypothetical protein
VTAPENQSVVRSVAVFGVCLFSSPIFCSEMGSGNGEGWRRGEDEMVKAMG